MLWELIVWNSSKNSCSGGKMQSSFAKNQRGEVDEKLRNLAYLRNNKFKIADFILFIWIYPESYSCKDNLDTSISSLTSFWKYINITSCK